MMRTARAALALGMLVALLPLAGCTDNTTGQVSGLIKVDGTPVEQGMITFVPEDGKGPTAGGMVQAGRYSVKVPVGTMKVVISMAKVVGMKKVYDTPNSPERPITKESLPDQYSDMFKTKLRFEVVPGANEKNWDLSTK
jgi:hypothetical protein